VARPTVRLSNDRPTAAMPWIGRNKNVALPCVYGGTDQRAERRYRGKPLLHCVPQNCPNKNVLNSQT